MRDSTRQLDYDDWVNLSAASIHIYFRDSVHLRGTHSQRFPRPISSAETTPNISDHQTPSPKHQLSEPGNDKCGIYLAESSIPNGGLGVFTTEFIPNGGHVGPEGLCILVNIPDVPTAL